MSRSITGVGSERHRGKTGPREKPDQKKHQVTWQWSVVYRVEALKAPDMLPQQIFLDPCMAQSVMSTSAPDRQVPWRRDRNNQYYSCRWNQRAQSVPNAVQGR